MFGWREKTSGIIAPDERLPWPNTAAMGVQHVLAMFGATVLAPIIMGFDVQLALFFSGIGTLLFFLIVGGRIPSYLGSSFAFIAPVIAAQSEGGIPVALGGIIVAGLIYTVVGFVVMQTGVNWIEALMPPVVTGAVVMVIGLELATVAFDMVISADAETGAIDGINPFLAVLTLAATMMTAVWAPGFLRRLPLLVGVIVGYLGAVVADKVDFDPVGEAAWIGLPDFVTPSFDGRAIGLIAPVALVLIAENTGHIKAVGAMTNRNLMPWLGRGFVGDGVATMVAGAGGGTGVTTYAENIGVMAMTRVYSSAVFVIASFVAIVLGFSPKFGALISTIPTPVLGGVATLLFGLIAATGGRIWVDGRVDFTKATNLFVVGITLIIGAGHYFLRIGDFELGAIGLATFSAIILYQILRFESDVTEEVVPADSATTVGTSAVGPEVRDARRTTPQRRRRR
jgi:uracil-xanthine permease